MFHISHLLCYPEAAINHFFSINRKRLLEFKNKLNGIVRTPSMHEFLQYFVSKSISCEKVCFENTLPCIVFPKALLLLYFLVSQRAPGSHKIQEQGNKNLVCSECVLHLIVNRRLQPRQGFKSTVVCITLNSIPGWQPYYQRHSEVRPVKSTF